MDTAMLSQAQKTALLTHSKMFAWAVCGAI